MSAERLSLTDPEKWVITRRRAGLNQRAMAERIGLSLTAYSLLERGVYEGKRPKPPALGSIKAHERCLIYRRRCGKTQQQVAADMEVCRYTVHQMETGVVDCTDLLCYWEA